MQNLVFATHNDHKLAEIRHMLIGLYEVLSPADLGCSRDIPETADTLEGNARLKADYIFREYSRACFADDTGLEVEALNGAPGVYSARYAGSACSMAENKAKLLLMLREVPAPRLARFRTVIAYRTSHDCLLFEGEVRGRIIDRERGSNGFGYDSLFIPDGYSRTFAEMSAEEKDLISHRSEAVRKFVEYLRRL